MGISPPRRPNARGVPIRDEHRERRSQLTVNSRDVDRCQGFWRPLEYDRRLQLVGFSQQGAPPSLAKTNSWRSREQEPVRSSTVRDPASRA